MLTLPMPLEIHHEPSDTEKKVAAADAAQATANTAQDMADEYKKAAKDAIASDPLADTQKIDIREAAKAATDSAIHLLRKLNFGTK